MINYLRNVLCKLQYFLILGVSSLLQGPVTHVRTVSIGEKRQPAANTHTTVIKNQALVTPPAKSIPGTRYVAAVYSHTQSIICFAFDYVQCPHTSFVLIQMSKKMMVIARKK